MARKVIWSEKAWLDLETKKADEEFYRVVKSIESQSKGGKGEDIIQNKE